MFLAHNKTHEKFYLLSRNMKASWTNSRPICKSYDMDVLFLETEAEADYFLNQCRLNHFHFEDCTLIGGMTLVPKAVEHWYWVTNGEQIDYQIKFAVGEPNHYDNKEFCLGLTKYSATQFFLFNDIFCNNYNEIFKFLCYKIAPIDW